MEYRHRTHSAVGVTLCAMAIVLVPGCEPKDTAAGDTDPAQYVTQLCAGLRDWREGLAADTAQLAENLAGEDGQGGSVETVVSGYEEYYGSARQRTEDLLTRLDKAGAPNLSGGDAYARKIRDGVSTVLDGVDTAEQDLADLDTEDADAGAGADAADAESGGAGGAEEFAAEAGKIRDDWGKVLLAVGKTFTDANQEHQSDDLSKAIAAEPACEGMV